MSPESSWSMATTARSKLGWSPVVSGVLLWLSYPPFDVPWIAWIALVPIMTSVLVRGARDLRDASAGAITAPTSLLAFSGLGGFLWSLGVFHPLLTTVAGTAFQRIVGIVGLSTLVASALMIFCALLWAVAAHRRLGSWILLVSPSLWIVIEFVYRYVAFGFAPYLGVSQWKSPWWLDVASVTGIHGVSFAIVAVNTGGAYLLVSFFRWIRRWRSGEVPQAAYGPPSLWPRLVVFGAGMALIGLGLAAIGIAINHGAVSLKRPHALTGPSVSVSEANPQPLHLLLIQPHITPQQYLTADQTPTDYYLILDDLIEQTEEALASIRRDVHGGEVLVVWPETVIHLQGWDDPIVRRAIDWFQIRSGVGLMIGMPRSPWSPRTDVDPGFAGQYNSLFAFAPGGQLVGLYDKIHVIPVAESKFDPGVKHGLMTYGAHVLGVGICSDVIVPHHALAAMRAGATSLHYVSSLGEIPRLASLVTAFHVFRAAEHRVYVTATATTGPSLVVDPSGQIVASTQTDERAALHTVLPPHDGGPSMYTRWGDWLPAFAAIFLCGFAVLPFRKQ